MATLQLMDDRVLIAPDEAERVSKGGIIIPDSVRRIPQQGVVICAGPGKKDEPITVKQGDHVMYAKEAGQQITVGDRVLLLMREPEIIAII